MEVPHGKWWQGMRVCSHWALLVVCWALLWTMASAETTMPPTSPSEPCLRGLATTVWGFVITLISLTVDGWGSYKNRDEATFGKVLWVFLGGATLNPLLSLSMKIYELMDSRLLMNKLNDMSFAKSYIKILSGCHVFVNISPTSYERFHNCQHFFENELELKDFSDALRIGSQVEVENLLRLTRTGKEMLIRANVLPPIEQLKILQGQLGFAIGATMVQAVGYMYGVIVRVVQDLHVSPIEVIAFVLNIVVMVKGMWHFYSSTCHRPLILFLDDKNEEKFSIECEKPSYKNSTLGDDIKTTVGVNFLIVIFFGIVVLLGGVLAFFITKSVKSLPIELAIPLIIVEGGLILFLIAPIGLILSIGIECLGKFSSLGIFLVALVPIINGISYIYALVVTIKYWSLGGFNIQSPNYLSRFLPFVG